MHKCDECGQEKPDVIWTTDPFAEEIRDIEIWLWLCSECWRMYADEI